MKEIKKQVEIVKIEAECQCIQEEQIDKPFHRPTDLEIIQVVASHFEVTEEDAINWLEWFDIAAAKSLLF